jgi:hypothetical protein
MTEMTYGMNFDVPTIESAQTKGEIEANLMSEIKSLWSAHQIGKASAKHTKEELKCLRLDLGHKLCEMKSILARTGRGGGWAAYLRLHGLPRATADRYVGQHEASMMPVTKRVRESITETTGDDVRRLVRSLLPRLRKVLTTPSWVEWFLVEIAFQLETADASPTSGRVEEADPVATGDSGGSSKTEGAPLTQAA